jgi:hypothetical protein
LACFGKEQENLVKQVPLAVAADELKAVNAVTNSMK